MIPYPTGTKLTEEDLYPGLYVQSAGNSECIYMIQRNESYLCPPHSKYYLIATHKITNSGIIEQSLQDITLYSTYGVNIIKTHVSDQLNREYKLNSLINEEV